METNFSSLPPLKRFRLMQQQQQKEEEEENNHHKEIPNQTEKITTPMCLPAKKRKACRDLSPESAIPAADSSFCLPAKKRVWAVQPLDLNLTYEPDENISNQEIQPQESPEIEFKNGGEISRSENPEPTEIIDDDGIACAVCQSTDGDPTDPIVLCDGCDLMVHASCYGRPLTDGIPDGDWFCARCTESSKSTRNKSQISCCLCPVSGGALKPTTDGRWAHLVCAIYVPEVFFEECEGREGINCSRVLKRRWGRKCCICEERNGCALDCSEPKCGRAFHVTCGLNEGLCVEYREGKKKGGLVHAFCKPHTHLWEKQQQTGKFKIVARDEVEK